MRKHKRLQIVKAVLRETNKAPGITHTLISNNLYCKVTHQTVWYWYKNRYTDASTYIKNNVVLAQREPEITVH